MENETSTRMRLTKRRDAGWFTGAAAGIGAYFGIDPLWVRLGFVIFTMFGGLGVLLYAFAIFLPDATQEEMQANPIVPRPYNQAWKTKEWYFGDGRWALIVAIILLALSISSAWDFEGPNLVLAVLLGGIGLYLLSNPERLANVRAQFFSS
jgi:phage shock protein PspC (stress-responsive transcriptional regulator)